MPRTGARTIAEIPRDVLDDLNAGRIATANLVEWLAIDQLELLDNILGHRHSTPIRARVEALPKPSVTNICQAIGEGLSETHAARLATHPSDMARCWAAYALVRTPGLTLRQLLATAKDFAVDEHFGVREIAWLAARPAIIANLSETLIILAPWTRSNNENIRRFASESTRPRGVWCAHIPELKRDPTPGFPLLEPLRADPSRYVQNSLANWLNDAAKSAPEPVRELCTRWTLQPNPATQYIVKRALRSL